MNYSNIQKVIAFTLLFFMLTGFTFRVPFSQVLYSVAYADDTESKNLVSILVDEEIYPYIKSEVKRYSLDIQNRLENTKPVIVPITKGATPYEIASINEKLYFEGEKSSNLFNNKLIGTVLIGNLPVPSVTDGSTTGPSVLPYTDFENKGFIYDQAEKAYKLNRGIVGDIKPEIWHGVIYPNTGTKKADVSAYKAFFAKSHKFYTKQGQFSSKEINANDPYVFYFDAIKEKKSINSLNYKAYEMYLNNLEDLTYRRYTKGLAKKVQDAFAELQDDKIGDSLSSIVGEDINPKDLKSNLNLDKTPDVQARYIINKIVKKFPEVLNTSSIGEMQKDVYNAGRYNVGGKTVNVDFVSNYITLLDQVSANILRDASDDLEESIDSLVKKGLSRKIAIPTIYTTDETDSSTSDTDKGTYTNIINGVPAYDITSASQCSIYRGSVDNGGKLVEANRGYNTANLQSDLAILKRENATSCLNPLAVNSRFGGNTPLNLNVNPDVLKNGDLKLKSKVLNGGIVPVFDIGGSKEVKDASLTPSPNNCLNPNFALTHRTYTVSRGGSNGYTETKTFNVPLSKNPNDRSEWSCQSPLLKKVVPYTENFDTLVTSGPNKGSCERHNIYLGSDLLKTYSSYCYTSGGSDGHSGQTETPTVYSYNFKLIDSFIEHKSPTRAQIEAQLKARITQDLPVDRDRYIDFISANGSYKKIKYPYLFRVTPENGKLSFEELRASLKKTLDAKSKEINNIITNSKTSGEVYNALKTGSYPSANVDLYYTLQNKGDLSYKEDGRTKKGEIYTKGNQTKKIRYEDLLLFAMYWNNLNSVPAKYKFVFENYLGSQFEKRDPITGEDANHEAAFPLPNAKTNYEIAYLKSEGDASKMIIDLDPESVDENPYKQDVLAMSKANAQIAANKGVGKSSLESSASSCSPPEGVPIWEWLPAVMCRLGEVTDTGIEVSDGTCGVNFADTENVVGKADKSECESDNNKNGIYDCIEKSDNLVITGDENLFYNSVGNLEAQIRHGKEINHFDSQSFVTLEVVKIEIPNNKKKSFTPLNLKVVYDKEKNIGNEDVIKSYISYPKNKQVAKGGIIKASISTSNKMANIYFKAKSVTKPYLGTEDKVLESKLYRLEVRDDKLFATSKRISLSDSSVKVERADTLLVSDKKNLFIYDQTDYRLDDNKEFLNSLSTSKEKTFIGVQQITKTGDNVGLEYPINVEIYNGLNRVGNKVTLNRDNLKSPYSLNAITKSGTYKIVITDRKGKKYKKEINVVPEKPSKLKTSYVSNYLENDGVVTQNVVTLYDKFDNVTSGEFYKLDFSISGSSVVFDEGEDKGNKTSVFTGEGFKVFRLKSTNKTGKSTVSVKLVGKDGDINFTEGGKDLVLKEDISVVDKFDIDFKFPKDMKVGGEEYTVNFEVKNPKDLNTTAFIKVDNLYAEIDHEQVEIKNGLGSFKIKTTGVAVQDAIASISIAGMRKSYRERFVVNPLAPFKVDIVNPGYIEPNSEGTIKFVLRDKYGNKTFNLMKAPISLEIDKKYLKSVTGFSTLGDGNGVIKGQNAIKGEGSITLKTTNIPGIVYFKGLSGSAVSGVGKLSVSYVFDSKSVNNMGYNALYTTLLGADYGNIYKKDSLANALIFTPGNKSLAVTGVLSNKNVGKNLITVVPKGDINIFESSDLTQDIRYKFVNNEAPLTFDIYNETLKEPVAKVIYKYSKANFVSCDSEDCFSVLEDKDDSKNYLGYVNGDNGNFKYSKGILTLTNSAGDKILNVHSDGSIRELKDGTIISIDENNLNPYLGLNITDALGKKLGYLIYYFNGELKYTRADDTLGNNLYTQSDSVLVVTSNTKYSMQFAYLSGKGIEDKNKAVGIYYRDSLGDKASSISSITPWGYENYEEDSLGWGGENKTLLSFSAGETVGEATQKYASVGLINIGDPVLALDKKKAIEDVKGENTSTRPFDSTIGKLIFESPLLLDYKVFDYDKDGKDDLVIFQKDGAIKLFEIYNGTLVFKSDIAKVADIGPKSKFAIGDFTNDGYDDIFFLNKDREPALLNNTQKDFFRVDVRDDVKFRGRPLQLEAYDMDADGKDDIVTLDDSGDINIYYGGGVTDKPEFSLNRVGAGFALTLGNGDSNSTVRKDYGSIYFSGLKQLNAVDDNGENFNYGIIKDKIKGALNDAKVPKKQEDFKRTFERGRVNIDALNTIIFEKYKYSPNAIDEELTQAQKENQLENEVANMEGVDASIVNDFKDSLTKLQEKTNGGLSYGHINTDTKRTTFIKSEYAETYGLGYSKEMIDINGKPLKSYDKIKVKVLLTNKAGRTLNNVALIEKIEDLFEIPKGLIVKVDGKDVEYKDIPNPSATDGFMVDGLTIPKNKSIVVEYELDIKQFDYGHIKLGKFKDNDIYGDIAFKDSKENCGDGEILIYSKTAKTYGQEAKSAVCGDEVGDSKLKKDDNKDGVPDYINELVNSAEEAKNGGSSDTIKKYAEEQLDKFVKDLNGDGNSNNDDYISILDSFDDDGKSVITIDVDMDKVSEDVQEIMDGFGCGFGGGCIPSPMNWAPLAPGGDPTLFGYPIGDGLHVSEGVPVFAFPTVGPNTVLGVPVPPFWPTNFVGAGGYFPGGISQFRLFVTPTLTGSAGIAVCTGSNYAAGYSPPPGISPLVAGGNCIVVAGFGPSCSDSDGDPSTIGSPSTSSGDLSVYNGNCTRNTEAPKIQLDPSFVKDFVDGKTGEDTFVDKYRDQLLNLNGVKTLPLFGGLTTGGGNGPKYSVGFNSTDGFSFEEPNEIKNKRIFGFPKPIMSWASRQLEEIATKITDFPRLILILPDVNGLAEGWDGFEEEWKQFTEKVSKGSNEAEVNLKARIAQKKKEIAKLEAQMAKLNSNEIVNKSAVYKIQMKKEQLVAEVWGLEKQVSFGVSNIKGAYEAISKLPFVKIDEQTVDLTLPWVSKATLDDAIYRWQQSLQQWKNELEDKKRKWSFGSFGCDGELKPDEKKACEQKLQIQADVIIEAESFLDSIERNIEVLESYKELPRDVNKLLRQKEVRLEQILCNIETISNILGKWIKDNGKIFKSWVELFILIKAILKSWQVLVDIFIGYETQCKQCKNERGDLLTFIFGLILPEIPIIKFPKWPDIILDVHNIRGGLNIAIPVFDIGYEPIVLPDLPELKLPEVPSLELLAELQLPEIPVLPEIELPTLPDLPTLPQVKLPNLPPAPRLPQIFGALEVVADLLKLITQVMCILKFSPFVPEWRAGDQIAFLTERTGYLNLDFLIDLSLPELSASFVDAIKVTSYVNLEVKFDEIAMIVQEALDNSVNKFGNNIANSIESSIPDLDFSNIIPSTIKAEVNINKDGVEGSVTPGGGDSNAGDIIDGIEDSLKEKGDSIKSELQGFKYSPEELIAGTIVDVVKKLDALDSQKDIALSGKEFTDYIYNKLHSEEFLGKPEFDELRKIWTEVKEYNYSKEDKFIGELVENNEDKFKEVRGIIEDEIKHNEELRKEIEKMFNGEKEKVTLVGSDENRFNNYNSRLKKYQTYSNEEDTYGKGIENARNNMYDKLASLTTDNRVAVADTTPSKKIAPNVYAQAIPQTENTCSGSGDAYKREYKGLYVNQNRLFDYLDEVDGNETTLFMDADKDGDEDLIYMMGNQLYLKENLTVDNPPVGKTAPITSQELKAKYLLKDFISSVDNLEETLLDNGYFNIQFSASTNEKVNNYRYESWQIIDRFEGEDELPRNENLRKYQVDAFADIKNATLNKNSFAEPDFISRNNLATITYVGNLPGTVLEMPKLINVYDKISSGVEVNVTTGTKLYAGVQDVTLTYEIEGKVKKVLIKAKTNIEILSSIAVKGLDGSLYLEGNGEETITNPTAKTVLGLPLLPGTTVRSLNFNKKATSLNIEYYDGSNAKLDFKEVYNYRLYDLGDKSDSYNMRVSVPNDFYYNKIYAFAGNIKGTYSGQKVTGPQIESDKSAPRVSLKNVFIPVYNKKEINIGDYIFANSENTKVAKIYMDSDLEFDSDKDGVTTNDKDVELYNGKPIKPDDVKFDFGPYDNPFQKSVSIFIEDQIGNKSTSEITIISYAPVPTIYDYSSDKLSGVLDDKVSGEPVSIFRYRNGSLDKITKDPVQTGEEGKFSYEKDAENAGLRVKKDGRTIAVVNDITGQIAFKPGYDYTSNTDVLASNHRDNPTSFPLIRVKVGSEIIYTQYLAYEEIGAVSVVSNFDEANNTSGIYLKLNNQSQYGVYEIPTSAIFDKGSAVVYDNSNPSKDPLFKVYRDGRIEVLNDVFKLKLSTYKDYVVYKLMKQNIEIAETLVIPEGNYVVGE